MSLSPDNPLTTASDAQHVDRPASSKRRGEFRPSHRHVFTVYGMAPAMPTRFPWVIYWRDWIMPERGPYSPWPPQHKPAYGGQTGASVWAFDRNQNLCIATTVKDSQDYHNFIFFNWGMRPCGESKVTGWREPDGTHVVIEDSSL